MKTAQPVLRQILSQFKALPLPAVLVLILLVMLIAQALIDYRLLAPVAEDVQRLSAEIAQARSKNREDVTTTATATPLRNRLDQVLSRLPDTDALTGRLEALHRVADEHRLSLRKLNYQRKTLVDNFDRCEIQADIAATYPAIRQFLRVLLQQDSAAAVESLEFSRAPGSGVVRAQLRLVLYSRVKS
jgi:Tfp pilus assembly protein PilO